MAETIRARQANNLQFERAIHEYGRWIAVAEADRSPAPAWWWGPAFEVRNLRDTMPAEWCSGLKLPEGSSFIDGAAVFLKPLEGQMVLPWPEDFPRRPKYDAPV